MIAQNMSYMEEAEVSSEIITVGGGSFVSYSGHPLPADSDLKDLADDSIVFFPGLGIVPPEKLPQCLSDHQTELKWLRRQYDRGVTIAAGCNGNFVLADAGLFQNKKATTSWMYFESFKQRYPEIELDTDSILLEHDRVISYGGSVCGLDLILGLVEKHVGKELARLCTKFMLTENRHPSKVPFDTQQPALDSDPIVSDAVDWIRGNLQNKMNIDDILEQVPTSRRNLVRRFKQTTGDSPQEFIQKMRVDRAKTLLETGSLAIEEIVERVGYQDNSSFTRLFRRHTNFSPKEYRDQYRIFKHH